MAKTKKKPVVPPPTQAIAVHDDDNDDDLLDHLMAQLDSRNEVVRPESAEVIQDNPNAVDDSEVGEKLKSVQRQDAKSRFKARQARKAAALAQQYLPGDPATEARLEREAQEEEEVIKRACDKLGLQIYQINPDGHCLFSAVADQLRLRGILSGTDANYATVRSAAADYIRTHPNDFLPFLQPIDEGRSPGNPDAGLMTPEQLEQYCSSIRDTAIWGGEPEIQALSRAYGVAIHVIQGTSPGVVVHQPAPDSVSPHQPLHISYHRRLYGLGEHYNSLRPMGAT